VIKKFLIEKQKQNKKQDTELKIFHGHKAGLWQCGFQPHKPFQKLLLTLELATSLDISVS
jgi:hypothetical protein